ncbi:hypothetical protein [Streptomyces sp. NPDC000618]|uniref:hypothetical protein n=1 Tax=Streptomyces sp. NPDC000618 TaxID=3154265 RepID=UPI0033221CDA
MPPEEPWRSACPVGHRLTGTGGGRLGRTRCAGGHSFGPSTLAVAVATAVVCVLLTAVDFTAHRLPDVLTLPLAAAAKRAAGIRGDLDHFGALGSLPGSLAILRDSREAGSTAPPWCGPRTAAYPVRRVRHGSPIRPASRQTAGRG